MGPKRKTKKDDSNLKQATSRAKKTGKTKKSNETERPETQVIDSSAQIIDALQKNWEIESDPPQRHQSEDISTTAPTSIHAAIHTEDPTFLHELARNPSVSNLRRFTREKPTLKPLIIDPSSWFSHPSADTAHVPSLKKFESRFTKLSIDTSSWVHWGGSTAPTSSNVVHDLGNTPMSAPANMYTVPFPTGKSSSKLALWSRAITTWPCRVFSTLFFNTIRNLRWFFVTVAVLTTWLVRELRELFCSSSFHFWLFSKKLILWSVSALLFFWYISCCWQLFYSNICSQPGISQLTFCLSAYVPPTHHEIKINETFTSANEKFARVASNVSIMHAFPSFITDLQWIVQETRFKIRQSSPSYEIFQTIAPELDAYFDLSSSVRHKLTKFNHMICYDVDWILRKQEIITNSLHEISRDLQRKNLLDFFCCIVNHPMLQRRVSANTRAEVNDHIQSLIARVGQSITAGEGLRSDFETLYGRLTTVQAVVQNGRISLDANRTNIIASRGFYWRLQNSWFSVASSSPDMDDMESHLHTLTQIHSVLFQSAQRINSTINTYYEIQTELTYLKSHLIEHKEWNENISPETLAKLVGVGTQRLRNEFEDWRNIAWEDYKIITRLEQRRMEEDYEPTDEINLLTRKIGAGKESNPAKGAKGAK